MRPYIAPAIMTKKEIMQTLSVTLVWLFISIGLGVCFFYLLDSTGISYPGRKLIHMIAALFLVMGLILRKIGNITKIEQSKHIWIDLWTEKMVISFVFNDREICQKSYPFDESGEQSLKKDLDELKNTIRIEEHIWNLNSDFDIQKFSNVRLYDAKTGTGDVVTHVKQITDLFYRNSTFVRKNH